MDLRSDEDASCCALASQPAQRVVAAPVLLEIWIILSTCLVAGGWLLSAMGQLNLAGYAALVGVTGLLCWRMIQREPRTHISRGLLRRFRRPLPLLFLLLAACALVGGMVYAPANYDALAYRLPRVLNWLSAERWHWIDSIDPRFNVRATGFEWLMSPLMLFTKGDRFTFLINFISFLLLPGWYSVSSRGSAFALAWRGTGCG